MENHFPAEHMFQAPNSNTCGPTSLAMVYKLQGQNISVPQILADFHQEGQGEATFVPQLARHLNAHGVATRLLVASSKIISPAWKDASSDELIANLKAWVTRHPNDIWHVNNLHLLFYLEEGGTLDIIPYTTSLMKAALSLGSIFIVCVDENWMWGHRLKRHNGVVEVNEIAGHLEGHFVVVTGYEGDMVHVLDPFPTGIKGRHGAYDIGIDQVINASLTWDPQIIEIRK